MSLIKTTNLVTSRGVKEEKTKVTSIKVHQEVMTNSEWEQLYYSLCAAMSSTNKQGRGNLVIATTNKKYKKYRIQK